MGACWPCFDHLRESKGSLSEFSDSLSTHSGEQDYPMLSSPDDLAEVLLGLASPAADGGTNPPEE